MGAFGGVVLNAFTFVPIGATLIDADARRQTLRNDLDLTLRARLVPGLDAPLTASAYWTAQTFRYLASHRHAGDEDQPLRLFGAAKSAALGPHGLTFQLAAWQDQPPVNQRARGTAPVRPRPPRQRARHRPVARRRELVLEGGVHSEPGRFFPSASARLEQRLGPLRLFASGAYTGQPVSPVERYGYGELRSSGHPGGAKWAHCVGRGQGRRCKAARSTSTLSAFAHRTSEALDLYVETGMADSVETTGYPRLQTAWRRA